MNEQTLFVPYGTGHVTRITKQQTCSAPFVLSVTSIFEPTPLLLLVHERG